MCKIIEERLNRLRLVMSNKKLQGILVEKKENVLYLSGFTGSSGILLLTKEKSFLITDFRYIEQAKKQATSYEIIDYNGELFSVINDILSKNSVDELGIENAFITLKRFKEYENKIKVKNFNELETALENLRIIKDEVELDLIKKAVKLADDAFLYVLKFIKPGVRESEIALEIEYFMRKNGAKGTSFETIVASGYRAAMPHGVASEKKINHGDIITMDFGAIYKDYCSDMTRTVFLGKPEAELSRIYDIVKEAQQNAVDKIKEGIKAKDVDLAARSIIEKNDYGKFFGHGVGHGVGINVHEEPRVSKKNETTLKKGMVITVEPGIYLSELGGVRIEDIVVVEEKSGLVLTSSSKEKIIL